MLTKSEMAILLGRSLTTLETANYDLYLNIAVERLESMLCASLTVLAEDRTFGTRVDYRTVYVDPFISVDSVTVDGNVVDESDYTIKQNDRFNGTWYNIIEFDSKQTGKNIVVDAVWGFSPVPDDLQLLLAQLFNLGSLDQTQLQKNEQVVKSKKIEDFSVTFKDGTTMDQFTLANSSILDKYSTCNAGQIRNGKVGNYHGVRSLSYN